MCECEFMCVSVGMMYMCASVYEFFVCVRMYVRVDV